MTKDEAIKRAEQLIQNLDRQIHDMEMNASLRSKLAGACFDVAVEHQKAIVVLIANDLNGSAFALIRLLFESYVRGLWFHKCATDADIEKFSRTGNLPSNKKIADLLAEIETNDAFKDGVLSEVKRSAWKSMNGFTHTGLEQIARRLKPGSIEANYDEDEIIEVINFTCGIGWLISIAICDIAGRADVASSIFAQIKAAFPASHQP